MADLIAIVVADLIAIYFVVDVVTTFAAISLYCKVADVITIICGRWKTTKCLYVMLADVIAMEVDGITMQGGFHLADVIAMWPMELSLVSFISILVLRCSTEPNPICVADGTCLHFYLGMDY